MAWQRGRPTLQTHSAHCSALRPPPCPTLCAPSDPCGPRRPARAAGCALRGCAGSGPAGTRSYHENRTHATAGRARCPACPDLPPAQHLPLLDLEVLWVAVELKEGHNCAQLCTTVHNCAQLCTTVHNCTQCNAVNGPFFHLSPLPPRRRRREADRHRAPPPRQRGPRRAARYFARYYNRSHYIWRIRIGRAILLPHPDLDQGSA